MEQLVQVEGEGAGSKATTIIERLFEEAQGWHCTTTRLAVCGLLHLYCEGQAHQGYRQDHQGPLVLSPQPSQVRMWVESFASSSYGDPLLGTCLMLLLAPSNPLAVQVLLPSSLCRVLVRTPRTVPVWIPVGIGITTSSWQVCGRARGPPS